LFSRAARVAAAVGDGLEGDLDRVGAGGQGHVEGDGDGGGAVALLGGEDALAELDGMTYSIFRTL
jgi:hypothetical protein